MSAIHVGNEAWPGIFQRLHEGRRIRRLSHSPRSQTHWRHAGESVNRMSQRCVNAKTQSHVEKVWPSFMSIDPRDQQHADAPTTAPAPSTVTRRSLLQRSVAIAAVATPLAVLAACGSSTSTGARPSATGAIASGATLADLKAVSQNKVAFTEIQQDEAQHVTFLQSALKSAARPKPTFKGLEQPDVMSFANVSMALENVGVGAYLFGASAISDKTILAAAASILTIEARHAGFLDVLLGKPISANGAFDKPLTQDAIVQAASPFIASLNGGPDPSKPLKTDMDILNFALLLEFLEADFYSTNVPKFFK